jgi:hypothetical protein
MGWAWKSVAPASSSTATEVTFICVNLRPSAVVLCVSVVKCAFYGESYLRFAICHCGTSIRPVSRVAKAGNSGNVRIRELIYLAICGLVAIGLYLAWQFLGLSNSHVKTGHELDPTESLNDH